MSRKSRFVVLTIILAVISFLLSPVLWPDPSGAMTPSPSLLPWFIFLSAFESISFGIGVSLLVFYWKEGQKHLWPFLALVWLLISWWPHDNFHRVAPMGDFVRLLFIEYSFHLTLMISGFILALYLTKSFSKQSK